MNVIVKGMNSNWWKPRTIKKEINGITYIVEYSRSPFWTYETPSFWLFLKVKLCSWHGQIWEVFPKGGRCGFETIHIKALFPRRKMKKFLDRGASWIWKICYGTKNEPPTVIEAEDVNDGD